MRKLISKIKFKRKNRLIQLLRKINFRGKNRLVKFLYPNKLECVIPYSKSKMFVDTSEHICWNVYWNGGYEKEATWVLDKYVNDKSVCLDVGANIGIYTILLAEKAQKVIAIEPHPVFFERLKQNMGLNGFDVELKNIGLSSKEGEGILYSPPEDMDNKSASMFDVNPELTEKITVKVDTLDSLSIEKLDFIKIDTDGSDADVILGGEETISKLKPTILFEYMKLDIVIDSYNKAIKFLEGLGYKISIVEDGYLRDFNGVADNFANLIAVND